MSQLFSPWKIDNLRLPNRIVIAPMCQYSAQDGSATDWHLIHLGHLALAGAGLLILEATAVAAQGRITPGCLGLYSDANEAALARVLEIVRKHSQVALAIQLAHAGRKGSSHAPWNGGLQIRRAEPLAWQTVSASALPHASDEDPPTALDLDDLKRVRNEFAAARRTPGPHGHRTARRAWLPAAPVPLAHRQPTQRCLRRQPAKPHAFSARGVRRRARSFPREPAGVDAPVCHRLGERLRVFRSCPLTTPKRARPSLQMLAIARAMAVLCA